MAQGLDALTREELETLIEDMAKNVMALDGTYFQSIEQTDGMDQAMHHDREAWRRFMPSEARRLSKLLDLGPQPGLEGLAKALPLHCTSLANRWEQRWEDDGSLVFRIVDCRVQNARGRKGMPYHPCKSAGIIEYGEFAKALDDRIVCECLSCYPEITDDTCNCAWRFSLRVDQD